MEPAANFACRSQNRMETLGKIFGSASKVRIMRLFLFNPQLVFDLGSISKKTKTLLTTAKKEVSNLERTGLIKRKSFVKDYLTRGKLLKKRVPGWVLDEKFPFLAHLQNFLIEITGAQQAEIVHKIKKIGPIKLLVVSGVFIPEREGRVDLLIVADKVKKNTIEAIVSDIESEIGKELKYSVFETSDFMYRIGVCDKLIRDILDYPHRKMINKLELV